MLASLSQKYGVTHPANENGLKWTEMDSFCSCQIQILIFWIHFYPISEFFKIHFNLYEEKKTKRFLSFSKKKKKKCRLLINFNLSRRIKTKWFLFFKSKKKSLGSYNSF